MTDDIVSRRHPIVVVGAPSSIGLRPHHETGAPQDVNRAPAVLREVGAIRRLHAVDLGDVLPPPYQDFERAPGKARNEAGVATYSRSLAKRIATAIDDDAFVVVLGGDCSIVLGCLLGAGTSGRAQGGLRRIGLAYIDGHADFASPEESQTGSVASMGLALAVGRGDSRLAKLTGDEPLVRSEDVVLVGRRDQGQSYGHEALAASSVLDLPWVAIAPGPAAAEPSAIEASASAVLERLGRNELGGFWILVDADVLNPEVMPAVGSPEAGGPDVDELAALLGRLTAHPKALGMALTLYDPSLDPDRSSAGRLVDLLAGSIRERDPRATPA